MSGKISKFWLTVAILLAVLAVGLCAFASIRGSIYIHPEGEPQETVVRFFDSLVEGDYPAAYACLSDYATLGLENEAASPESARVYEALRDSFDYTLVGPCQVDQLTASQTVEFRYLDVRALENAVAGKVDGILEDFVSERPRNEIYDENDRYLPELTDEVYATALEETLEDAERFYVSVELPITLDYANDQWLMRTGAALLSAVTGGAA